MCPNFFGRRVLPVGLVLCALLSASVPIARADKPASLSGYVYLDFNRTGLRDLGDYAICNARLSLLRSDDAGFSMEVLTDKNGFYSFSGIAPSTTGTFTIKEFDYTCLHGTDNLGSLLTDSGVAVSDVSTYGQAHNAAGDPLKGSFTGISLLPGYAGEGYNFGQNEFPLELLTKRLYMDWGAPSKVITVVPEPSVIALFASALAAIGLTWRRRR